MPLETIGHTVYLVHQALTPEVTKSGKKIKRFANEKSSIRQHCVGTHNFLYWVNSLTHKSASAKL